MEETKGIAERIKEAGAIAFGIVILIGVLSIPVLFILGAEWAAKNLLQPLVAVGWIAVGIDVLVLLPLSMFGGMRHITGPAIFLSSFLFGLISWLLGFVVTYWLWGFWGVLIGILLFGGAVVPFALLASLFKGEWLAFFSVLGLVVVTFGSRIVGMLIAEAAD